MPSIHLPKSPKINDGPFFSIDLDCDVQGNAKDSLENFEALVTFFDDFDLLPETRRYNFSGLELLEAYNEI